MPDDAPPLPRRLPGWWALGFLALGLVSVLVAFAAVQTTGSQRRFALVGLFACALGVAGLASLRTVQRPPRPLSAAPGTWCRAPAPRRRCTRC